MRHYCTLFDANYLPRAVALHRSLERCGDEFLLHAVCMDEESLELMGALALPHVRPIAISEVEAADPGLLAVRADRIPREYCWTATPVVCLFVLDGVPDDDVLTYLDADLCFSSSPEPLFAELGDGSVMVVPHRSPDEETLAMGIYNVGWVSFRNDLHGRAAAAWWRERCLEWCHDRVEPGRFGDQKYLDDWPERFSGVRVCESTAAGLAPWNDEVHALTEHEGRVLVDGEPLVFYHHAGLRVYEGGTPSARVASLAPHYDVNRDPVRLVWTMVFGPRPRAVRDLVWRPYVRRLAEAHQEVVASGARPTVGMRPSLARATSAEKLHSWVRRPALRVHRRMPAWSRRLLTRVLRRR